MCLVNLQFTPNYNRKKDIVAQQTIIEIYNQNDLFSQGSNGQLVEVIVVFHFNCTILTLRHSLLFD